MFKFNHERLDEDTLLGRGASGEVFPYQKNPQDLRWVVKKILAKNIDDLINCLPEIVLGFACDHPCVVPVKGYFVERVPNSKYFHVYMKIPRMKETLSTSLKTRKRKNLPFAENEIIQHFYSLTCGLKYLHSKKIYHGDIRHDNLLLDEQGNLKIADVGIAKHVEDEESYHTITGQKGTYFYTAPEILGEKAKKSQLSKADVWSLGVVILELCVFDFCLLNSSLPQDKLKGKTDELLGSLEGKFKQGLIALVKRLLNLDSGKRPDIDQIKDELEKNFEENLVYCALKYENLCFDRIKTC